jgi:hypothetical protein
VTLPGPDHVRPQYENKDFAAGYINFYVCNGAVLCPEFGHVQADRNTKAILREQFPDATSCNSTLTRSQLAVAESTAPHSSSRPEMINRPVRNERFQEKLTFTTGSRTTAIGVLPQHPST